MSVNFGCDGPFPVHLVVVTAIEGAVVEAGLGVLLQLLGQVGARRGGCHVGPVAAILGHLQLLHKAHRPARGGREREDVRVGQEGDLEEVKQKIEME